MDIIVVTEHMFHHITDHLQIAQLMIIGVQRGMLTLIPNSTELEMHILPITIRQTITTTTTLQVTVIQVTIIPISNLYVNLS